MVLALPYLRLFSKVPVIEERFPEFKIWNITGIVEFLEKNRRSFLSGNEV